MSCKKCVVKKEESRAVKASMGLMVGLMESRWLVRYLWYFSTSSNTSLLASFAELQASERAAVSSPTQIIFHIQQSTNQVSGIKRYNRTISIETSEESHDGPPQQLNARKHDGWQFSASRCGE